MASKSQLSAAMLALIAAGATSTVMMSQFQNEKEGLRTAAYQDGGGVWTICGGTTFVNGKPVVKEMGLSAEQCVEIDKVEQAKALAWVERNVRVSLTETQKVGIASFCPWSIGPARCFSSTFWKKLNAGDRRGACAEIRRWIWDGGRDCRIRSNNCYGQVLRREQEAELTCWGLDE